MGRENQPMLGSEGEDTAVSVGDHSEPEPPGRTGSPPAPHGFTPRPPGEAD
jgi:hypothetical protein